MTSQVNTALDFSDPQVVDIIEADEHLRTLPLDSEDLKAAVAEKLTKKVEDDAPAGDDENETADADDDQSTEDADDDEDDQPQPKKKPRGVIRRIEKLAAEKHDLQRRIAELEAQVQQSVKQSVEEAVGDFTFDEPKPKFDDFDNLADYTEAVADWKIRKVEAEKAFKQEQQSLEKQVKEIASKWEELEKAVKKELRDYSQVVTPEAVVEANPSQAAKEFLAESDIGPKVVYHLLNDEDLAAEFADATPSKQVRILTRLEDKLSATEEEDTSTTPKKTVKLPTPLPKGKATGNVYDLLKDAANMSDAEWHRLYDQQVKHRR